MTTILSLPCEIYRIILNYEFIQLEDVQNLSYTCKRLQDVIADATNEAFWQEKFSKKPYLKKIFDMLELTNINYEEQARLNMETRKKLHQYLSKMPQTHYCMTTLFAPEEIEDFLPVFYPPAGAHPMNYYYLMDELTTILQKECKYDFGEQHYAHKLLYCIQIYYLRYEWHNFMSRSEQQQTLETAVGIIDQWFELYYCEQHRYLGIYEHIFPLLWNKSLYIRYMFDTYAKEVLETIQKEYPKHSVLSVSKEQFLFWKHNNTNDCHWNKVEGQQILEAIYKVISVYKDQIRGYKRIFGSIKKFSIEHRLFIYSPMVTKCYPLFHEERPWTHLSPRLSMILFEALARRFGMRISKIGCYLLWRPQYGMNDDQCHFYIDPELEIDIFENNRILQPQITEERLDYRLITEEIKKIKICCNSYSFERYCLLQFRLLLEPDNILLLRLLYDYSKVTNANSSMLLDALNRCRDPYQTAWNLQQVVFPELNLDTYYWPPYLGYVQQRQITPKYRTEDINRTICYAVGMFVSITEIYNEIYGIGVICGWYMNFDSLPEIAKEKVVRNRHNIQYNVPYYRVVCHNYLDTYRSKQRHANYYYATNIEYICENHIIAIVSPIYPFSKKRLWTDCGQYFSHFSETYNVYVPNKMLASEYPDDKEYMIQYYSNHPNTSNHKMKSPF